MCYLWNGVCGMVGGMLSNELCVEKEINSKRNYQEINAIPVLGRYLLIVKFLISIITLITKVI